MKLFSVKSEIRYSPNTIFVKLVGSHMFQQLVLRISEIRRSKMVCVFACDAHFYCMYEFVW